MEESDTKQSAYSAHSLQTTKLNINQPLQSPTMNAMTWTRNTAAAIALVAMLISTSSALPARRSSSATGTGSRRTGSSNSGSASGNGTGTGTGCERELSARARERLISNIRGGLNGLETALEVVHVWPMTQPRATVRVYGPEDAIIEDSTNCSALHSDYGYAIAASVSFLQLFVRPVGDVLTNETVREVIKRETGFAGNFSTIREKLATVAQQVYNLVKGYGNIHRCVLPRLPLADDNTVLKPSRPRSRRPGSMRYARRDMVVDGLANELQGLVIDLEFALDCFFD